MSGHRTIRFTRRAFAAGLGALPLAGLLPGCKDKGGIDDSAGLEPAPDRAPEPEAWAPEIEEDASAFAWGVVVGDPSEQGAIVGVRTSETEALSLVLAVAEGEGWTVLDTSADLAPADGVVQVELSDLEPDTAYSFYFLAADGARRSAVGRFRTAQATDASLRKIVFGATSCFGGNWPFPSLQFAADERLDFFLLLGDTVYADGASTVEEYREHYKTNFGAAPLQALVASTGVIATWDDHEVDNNWSWSEVSEEKFAAARAAFWEALPQGRGPGGTGIWRRIAWGPAVDLFVLDCRGEKMDGNYISSEQMAWFKAGLSASTARFKIVLNSVPITDMNNFYGAAYLDERWQGYAQRDEILSYIRDNDIQGVLWVSGDHHLGMVNRVDVAGRPGEEQWEVLTGPAGSFINVLGELLELDDQYHLVVLQWNWTRFELDPNLGTAFVQFIGDDGSVLGEKTLEL